jgi:hypothetical protein
MIYSHILTYKEIRTYRYVRETIFAVYLAHGTQESRVIFFVLHLDNPEIKMIELQILNK